MNDDQVELAHWYYEQKEWEQFIDSEWASRRAQMRRENIMFAAPFIVFVLLVSGVGVVSNGWLVGAIVLTLFGGFLAIGFGLPSVLAYDAMQSWYEEVRTVQPEVLITSEAVVFGGPSYIRTDKYRSLRGFAQSLRVTVVSDDPSLLSFDIIEHALKGKRTQIWLPIPAGKEDEAREIVDYFSWANRVARKASPDKG